MSDIDFLEDCAISAGWTESDGEYTAPMEQASKLGLTYMYDMGEKIGISALPPHLMSWDKSYDWAYVLMQVCHDKGLIIKAHQQINKNGMMDLAFSDEKEAPKQPEIPTPSQIAIACQEVIDGQ